MTDINRLLRDADPLRSEDSLSSGEAHLLRTAMLEAASAAPATVGSAWYRPLTLAAIVVVLIGLSGIMSDRSLKPGSEPRPSDPAQIIDSTERRQIQFATPGGTRIIWTLEPQLSLQDSLQETKP